MKKRIEKILMVSGFIIILLSLIISNIFSESLGNFSLVGFDLYIRHISLDIQRYWFYIVPIVAILFNVSENIILKTIGTCFAFVLGILGIVLLMNTPSILKYNPKIWFKLKICYLDIKIYIVGTMLIFVSAIINLIGIIKKYLSK